jgi:Sulfotransferase family
MLRYGERMRVSDSHRLLFVHVPKTGGKTIEKVLDESLDDVRFEAERHHRLDEILLAEPALSDYWIFGFVRNPWARMLSWWSMIRVAAERAAPYDIRKFQQYPLWSAVKDYCWEFETFTLRGMEEVERLRTPQIEFLTSPGRRADFIGRTETIAADARVIRQRLGLSVEQELPHRNRGQSRGDYRAYYTAASRDAVAAAYKSDIDEFGYEF